MNPPRTMPPVVHASTVCADMTREERLYKAINEYCFHDDSGTCHDCIFRREKLCPVACVAAELAKAMDLL